MDEPDNPYAPPKTFIAPIISGPTGRYWRSGNFLRMEVGAILPCRCVKCNAPAETPVKVRKIYWNIGVAAGLCPRHRRRRERCILIGWAGSLGGIAGAIWGSYAADAGLVVAGIISFLAGVIVGPFGSRIVTLTHMDERVVTLSGCGEAFLASLPSD